MVFRWFYFYLFEKSERWEIFVAATICYLTCFFKLFPVQFKIQFAISFIFIKFSYHFGKLISLLVADSWAGCWPAVFSLSLSRSLSLCSVVKLMFYTLSYKHLWHEHYKYGRWQLWDGEENEMGNIQARMEGGMRRTFHANEFPCSFLVVVLIVIYVIIQLEVHYMICTMSFILKLSHSHHIASICHRQSANLASKSSRFLLCPARFLFYSLKHSSSTHSSNPFCPRWRLAFLFRMHNIYMRYFGSLFPMHSTQKWSWFCYFRQRCDAIVVFRSLIHSLHIFYVLR